MEEAFQLIANTVIIGLVMVGVISLLDVMSKTGDEEDDGHSP